jgi:hypothetical protein
MKQCKLLFLLLFTLSLLLSTAFAQWLETTIYIPDSLCGVINPQTFAYNATNNRIYVGGRWLPGLCILGMRFTL